jgi:hypothetical protein
VSRTPSGATSSFPSSSSSFSALCVFDPAPVPDCPSFFISSASARLLSSPRLSLISQFRNLLLYFLFLFLAWFSWVPELHSQVCKISRSISNAFKSGDLGSKPTLLFGIRANGFKGTAMIDSGATSQFIDYDYAKKHGFLLRRKAQSEILSVFDGSPALSGMLTHECDVKLVLDQHVEEITLQVTKLGSSDIVLGMSWLDLHDPQLHFRRRHISFTSGHCEAHCLPKRQHSISFINASALKHLAEDNVSFCGQLAFSNSNLDLTSLETRYWGSGTKIIDLKAHIPKEYHDFLHLFEETPAKKLPPHRYIDHKIPLEKGSIPPFGPLYSLSQLELEALRKFLEEHLSKGFLRASSSPAASPILFAKKKDGSLRLCVDYRGLNKITIKNRYPLPRIDETLDQLRKARYYTRFDVRDGYYRIRMADGEEWKTAMRTRYGLFEWLVMPMGLTNAPATFQNYINDTLRKFIDIFCVVYIDDILIYSDTLEDHVSHVRKVLAALQDAGLYLKPEKCEFHTTETEFLGFIISHNGISMDPRKVQTIQDWETPENVHDVQVFLGFANFYRRFIKGYSRVCRPLFKLLQKNYKFCWSPEAQNTFQQLKERFTSAPILKYFEPSLPSTLEVDSSDTVTSGVLLQPAEKESKILHPIAYFSKKMLPAECNYSIGEKELLAIVNAFKEWRHYLEGAAHQITVLSDHLNLKEFTSTMKLNRRQARWAEKLAAYDFVITHVPGKSNGRADALTRRSGDLPKEGDEHHNPASSILFPKNFSVSALNRDQLEDIKTTLEQDPEAQSIIDALNKGLRKHPRVPIGECEVKEDLLYVYGLVYIPNNLELQRKIIASCHDHPAAGHPGQARTYEMVSRHFWWPKMRHTIARFIRNCDTCVRTKPARHAPFGLLRPLEIPQRRWASVSMDFITGLPESKGSNTLLVMVDRLTKMAHFVPTTETVTAEGLATLVQDNLFRLHGLPENFVSDRDKLFTSQFWKELMKLLKVKTKLSTAYHPQTDGQTERVNAQLEQYLRAYSNYQQDNWVELLSMAEFSYNNSVSAATGVTPFFANYGYHPRYDLVLAPGQDLPAPETLQDYSDKMQSLQEHLQAEIALSQSVYSEQADRHRLPAPDLRPGDFVWLLRRHHKTNRPSSKLDYKRLGRFEILQKVSSHAYKLDLPPTMRCHPVFHISLLEPAASDPLPGQTQPPAPPVEIEGEDFYEIEAILDSRKYRNQVQYLVQWEGYDHPTWEPLAHFSPESLESIREFHTRYPSKPRPRRLS